MRAIFIMAVALMAAGRVGAGKTALVPPPLVYVTSDVWSAIIEVDLATGDRRLMELSDYPRIIKATDYAVELEGSLLIETVDALGRNGIYRVNPASGAKWPVSGGVDGFDENLLGGGPGFVQPLNTLVRHDGGLAVLRDFTGPMEVSLPGGDRRVIIDDGGTSPILTRPDDMVMVTSGTLLIADRFEGLWQVEIASGALTRRFEPGGGGGLNPRRMDILPDGRLVFVMRDPDADAVWALNLKSGDLSLFSGEFGGLTSGEGPGFEFAFDVAVDVWGRVFVFDAGRSALMAIEPDGDRAIISSPDIGEGDGFFDVESRPALGTWQRFTPMKHFDAWIIN